MAAEKEAIKVGTPAPDFTLKDHNGADFRLSESKGGRVILSFHPLAWTGVCADQMQALERNVGVFTSLNTVAVGINIDSVPSKKAWAESLGIEKIRLLSDFWPHGYVAQRYGIFRDKDGFSERANIVLNERGEVIFSKVYEISQLPDFDEIIKLLRQG
jgi:peroxiredoxin